MSEQDKLVILALRWLVMCTSRLGQKKGYLTAEMKAGLDNLHEELAKIDPDAEEFPPTEEEDKEVN